MGKGLHPDWGHILAIPLISLYFVFRAESMEQLRKVKQQVSWWGLPVLFAGMFIFALGIYPARTDMIMGWGMIIALFGLVGLIGGTPLVKVLWFPILYLFFMVPIGERLWSQVAWHLAQIAATLAGVVLQMLAPIADYVVAIDGIHLTMEFTDRNGDFQAHPLNVAEACSGLRMLSAFVALGVAIAFISPRPLWQRLFLMFATIPVAIGVNVARVTVLGLSVLWDPEFIKGESHIFVGLLMLIPAALIFMGMAWILDNLFVEEEVEDDESTTKTQAKSQPSPEVTENTTSTEPLPSIYRSQGPLADWGWLTRGVIAGTFLALLVGSLYYLSFINIATHLQPTWLSGAMAPAALVGAAVLLIVLLVLLVKRSPAAEALNQGNLKRQSLALGLGASILLTGLLGQNAVLATTESFLVKKPLPPRFGVYKVPELVGTGLNQWVMIHQDPPLPDEIREQLGTDEYFSRVYKHKTSDENAPVLAARLHIAYYTGGVDTIPHVPEECRVAGGAIPIGRSIVEIGVDPEPAKFDEASGQYFYPSQLLPEVRLPSLTTQATVFSHQTVDRLGNRFDMHPLYFFVVNGEFVGVTEQLRAKGFDPRDEYGYWTKIEVDIPKAESEEAAVAGAEKFLSAILPEIMACLPDWYEVKAGRYPEKNDPAKDDQDQTTEVE